MVFQEPLLFDTTVFENVAAGLKLRGLPNDEIARRAGESLERFKVGHLAGRSARTLSGGEAQRVSLARALAVAPEILLLDEPFAALDPPAREGLIEDLGHTLRETGTTTVFATHDRSEAQRLADRVAVLDCGRLRQVGSALEVLRRPADAFVASFVGRGEPAAGQARGGGRRRRARRAAPGWRTAPARAPPAACRSRSAAAAPGMRAGAAGLLCVRPEDVVVAAPGERGGGGWRPTCCSGRVTAVAPQGPFQGCRSTAASGSSPPCRGTSPANSRSRRGRAVTVVLRPSDLYVIPRG